MASRLDYMQCKHSGYWPYNGAPTKIPVSGYCPFAHGVPLLQDKNYSAQMKNLASLVLRICILSLLLPTVHFKTLAQNKTFAIGTTTPNANAALQVEAPTGNQGFIMPRLTTAQRTAPGFQGVLSATDAGLMVYDTDLRGIFIWNGSLWAGASRLALPYTDSVLSAPTNSNLLNMYYAGTAPGNVGVARFENLNATNAFSPLFVRTSGTGSASNFIINNAANTGSAVNGNTNGTGPAIRGFNSGAGNGFGGLFQNTNAANNFPAIQSSTLGTGPGVRVLQNATSLGSGVDIILENTANTTYGLNVNQQGVGNGANITVNNAASSAPALNINHNGTGNAITANRPIQATSFIGDGSLLTNIASSDLTYPFKDSVTTAITGNDVFALKYNNAASKRVLRVESLSPTNGSSAVSVQQDGTGNGVFSRINNATSPAPAVWGTTNSNFGGALAPPGVYGEATGTGSVGGAFRINNTANTFPALFAETNGSGPALSARNIGATDGLAGFFSNTVATNKFPAIQASTAGSGPGVRVIQNASSVGSGMDVFMQNVTGTAVGLSVDQQGLGAAANFNVSNTANGSSAVIANSSGTGDVIFSQVDNASTTNAAIKGRVINTGGTAGAFEIFNPTNSNTALSAVTNGTGAAIQGQTSTGFTAVYGRREGATNGNAGLFDITDAANTFPALQSNTVGTGAAGVFKITNTGSSAMALLGETNGANLSAGVYGLNTGNGFGVLGRANGTSFGSAAVYGEQLGTGDAAGAFRINNPANTLAGLYGETNGTGAALFANNLGSGRGAQVQINNASNSQAALRAFTNGTGNAGFFTINNASSSANAIQVETNGTGNAISAINNGTGFGIYARAVGATDAVYGAKLAGDGTGSAGNFAIQEATNNASALFSMTNAPGGSAIGAINSANGNAVAVFTGGVRMSTQTISSGSTVANRAMAYLLDGSVAGTLTITFPLSEGETFYFFNATGDAVYINSLANEILPGEGTVMIVLGGVLRAF
jgi:hypothetical protein